MNKIIVIGSGNVAHHLIQAILKHPELELVQIYARNPNALSKLSLPEQLFCTNIQHLKKADLYILAISDNSIAATSALLPFEDAFVVHTSGTVSYRDLDPKNRRGVFYPLQTFSKNKPIDFKEIPLCLETENTADFRQLQEFAAQLSQQVYSITEAQRKSLHVAAVFVNNFVNHMFTIGQDICLQNNVPFRILEPLIAETVQKIKSIPAVEAQTGPAVRHDSVTIERHLESITADLTQTIYKNITQSIQNYHVKKF